MDTRLQDVELSIMKWSAIFFEKLGINKMLVTGPQRSGTTFIAFILAQDLGWTYVDEGVFDIDNKSMFEDLLGLEQSLVIQCPGMMRWIHEIQPTYLNTFVAVCRRDVEKIRTSERKRGWKFALYEKGKYCDSGVEKLMSRPICEIKYDYFDNHQRGFMAHQRCLDVDYPHDVRGHPLYIEEQERDAWGIKQVRPGEPWVPVVKNLTEGG